MNDFDLHVELSGEKISFSSQDPEFESPMGIHFLCPFFEPSSELLGKWLQEREDSGQNFEPGKSRLKSFEYFLDNGSKPSLNFSGFCQNPGLLGGNRKAIRDEHSDFSPGASSFITAVERIWHK